MTEIADSYVCGVADAPLLGNTIGRSLDLAARRWADREALVSPSHGVRWTWKELAERVDALAAGFLALGLEPGARIGIWQAKAFPGVTAFNVPGAPAYFELITRDYEPSVGFYRDVFGWAPQVVSDTPDFRLTALTDGEETIAGIMDGTAFLPAGQPGTWMFYVKVADTDAALARVTELGGSVTDPAMDTPYGRLAGASDPTGARFKLVS